MKLKGWFMRESSYDPFRQDIFFVPATDQLQQYTVANDLKPELMSRLNMFCTVEIKDNIVVSASDFRD